MEKKKLKLDNIKVESFITMSDEDRKTIQGAGKDEAASWLLSGCLTSFRCTPQTILEDRSATWTMSPYLQMCAGNSREQLSAMEACPPCVKIKVGTA